MYMAKAVAAFIMAMITALLGTGVIPVVGPWHMWLTIVSALATGVITYAVPNRGTVTVPTVVP